MMAGYGSCSVFCAALYVKNKLAYDYDYDYDYESVLFRNK